MILVLDDSLNYAYGSLWGASSVQVYYYFNVSHSNFCCVCIVADFYNQTYPKDPAWIKTLVNGSCRLTRTDL